MHTPKQDLVVGSWYFCKARNFKFGKWIGNCFEYQRTKFNSVFTDYEFHWDDGPPHGTVKPYYEVTEEFAEEHHDTKFIDICDILTQQIKDKYANSINYQR
jgi:hypothetical protein